ncbi:MAG: serine/threonine protein kinase [Calothrix sp. SM1_7_51]|nr:serine/threonine protein kinase [Calothrix sp. SM1_7_51]
MSLCVNPNCPNPNNSDTALFCLSCGSKLLLKERYRPTKLLGAGGFGRTFLAVDEDIPSKPCCCVKQFQFLSQNPQALSKASQLFKQEAVQLDNLGKNHPQIPSLLASFEQDGQLYLVQEFIEGVTLDQELEQQGVYNEAKIWQLLQDLLPVLQFIHNNKVIHRDIKPENIIRNKKGTPILIDFGVAKLITETALVTQGTTVGTVDYAPPEQMRGTVYPASDLFSLGVTCIRLMTGVRPIEMFDAQNQVWIWRQFLPSGTVISDKLNLVLDKLIDSSLKDRYQSAEQVLQVIQYELSSPPPAELTPPTKISTAASFQPETRIYQPSPQIPTAVSSPTSSQTSERVSPPTPPPQPDKKISHATKFVYWLMGEKLEKLR